VSFFKFLDGNTHLSLIPVDFDRCDGSIDSFFGRIRLIQQEFFSHKAWHFHLLQYSPWGAGCFMLVQSKGASLIVVTIDGQWRTMGGSWIVAQTKRIFSDSNPIKGHHPHPTSLWV
jgi:hypothetical protein